MAATPSDKRRFERYARVVQAVAARDSFTLDDVKHACAEEQAAFVTRIVGNLTEDDILAKSETPSDPEYRWVADRESFSPSRWIESKIFNDRITRSPVKDRPRERLLAHGAHELRLAELFAILIRAGRGGESALQAGEKIATQFADRVEELPRVGRGELKEITRVVGDTAYCQIMAGIELGRRIARAAAAHRPTKIGGSQDAIDFCRQTFARLAEDGAQEEFHIVTLDTKNHPLGTHRVSVGALDQTIAQPRDVFRPAIKDSAKSILLVHNHPSGDPTPSEQDRTLTQRLEEAGRIVGIQILDHIIVARNGVVSLKEMGP